MRIIYRAAAVDLADVLVATSTNGSNFDKAVALYKQAWQQGVLIAGFRLGQLYEHGLQPDMVSAWRWYQLAADAGQPNALARCAERDERSSLDETDPQSRNGHLLAALTLYTAAAELAKQEDWPDDAWKTWRYRRATISRLLAREGMMRQVADTYDLVRAPKETHSPSLLARVQSMLRR